MKVLKITSKNLKLLMRSKTSMLVIIFGPLLIMLLVGFAFNNPAGSMLNIGYYSASPEKSNLTLSFVDALKSNPGFVLSEYSSEEQCTGLIAQGKLHICIIFPVDFVITNNNTNEIVFYVDQSRANFVYAVIDTVSQKVDLTSSQLSYQMTSDLLNVISSSQSTNSQSIMNIISLKNDLNNVSSRLKDVQVKLASLDFATGTASSTDAISAIGTISNDVSVLKSKGLKVVELGEDLVDDIDEYVSSNGTDMLEGFDGNMSYYKGQINNASNATLLDINKLITQMNTITSDIDKLNKRLETAKSTTSDSTLKIALMQSSLNQTRNSLDLLKADIEKTQAKINALRITSAESIVNPIRTKVTPINTKGNNLNFIFPYMVILIIVFISIMLSSTIIIMEKTSKAYFRNFTTPTSDFTFVISTFLTSFLVVILQLVLILLLAYYFLNTTIFSNIYLSLLLIFCAIILFNLLGMIIGYMFNSQEAVTMASISVGSVLLFLSNLVLPLETMSLYVQEIARYNPYVLASELLKKLTLFGSSWNDVYMEFVMIGAYIAVAFVFAVIIQKMSKIQYISKRPISKQILKKDDIIDKYFKLKSGVLLRDEHELYEELQKMSDMTFKEYVDDKKNDFESWLILNNKNELAKIVGKSRTRKEMISNIDKYNSQITGIDLKGK